ncbi:RNA polymerase II-associated [Pisolithus orientalis]|uniref:RNA polymerase II-associated n=1 Tax=Pisolithus orientalis TaxID=936130 RepID=UPI0022248419|nr:RNA polymerase II-associated [Pisolithus orientalis]KAI6010676.1 RNA polymerase II-associated [Pisolithus orientalis]
MSSRKSKLDLLIRVRYSNPLPPPPCPPKLLDIPTDPMRYARPEFLNAIANETPLPMIIDAECGMPLDLGLWECLWGEDADESALNPDPNFVPPLDPKDRFLLGDPSSSSLPYTNGTPGPTVGLSTPLPAHVPWLRKTEYLSREGVQRSQSVQEIKHLPQNIDISRAAQLRDIEASFAACNEPSQFSLSTLRHPNKPEVTAVESYEIFPDADIWANAYDLFRFSERPGDRPIDVDDPRLDCAILRPMESDGDHFLAYYLTDEDGPALALKASRFEAGPLDLEEPKITTFRHARDYETVKIEQDVPNEFLLVLDDGNTLPKTVSGGIERTKAAYYKNIERKMTLKKRRVNNQDAKLQLVHMSHVPMSKEELDEREELMAEVLDPMYLRGDVDADGEGEIDVDAVGQATDAHAESTEGYGTSYGEGIMADIF